LASLLVLQTATFQTQASHLPPEKKALVFPLIPEPNLLRVIWDMVFTPI
jgi:hypothetical protein